MSGRANVAHWLSEHEVVANDALVERLLAYARRADPVLSDEEILRLVEDRNEP